MSIHIHLHSNEAIERMAYSMQETQTYVEQQLLVSSHLFTISAA